jgi:hypothetical protein
MRKQLLLAATLGVLTIMPAPVSAQGHGPVYPNVESSFGIRIIVRDGPKVVHRHHHAKRHLRPQPWPGHFRHHTPSSRWFGSWRHQRHFHWRDRDHKPWFRAPGVHFRHDHANRWLHAPWHRGRPAFRNHFRHDRFQRGRPRSDGHRHRD